MERLTILIFQLFRCSPITVNRDSGFVIRESCDAKNKKPIPFENRLSVDQTILNPPTSPSAG